MIPESCIFLPGRNVIFNILTIHCMIAILQYINCHIIPDWILRVRKHIAGYIYHSYLLLQIRIQITATIHISLYISDFSGTAQKLICFFPCHIGFFCFKSILCPLQQILQIIPCCNIFSSDSGIPVIKGSYINDLLRIKLPVSFHLRTDRPIADDI